jgi:pyruvate dehydrogenase E2 component (dihydrolipoamide acetyltransferase)
MVTFHDEADITDMEAFRKSIGPEAEKLGYKVSPLMFIIKALTASLQAFPRFNSSLSADGQSLVMKKYYNIGIAVDTPNGLVVPVIKDTDKKSIYQLCADMAEISKKARDGKLGPNDMSGGCITISSLGGIGGTAFTPIVNAPEVAILGVTRSYMKPVWDGAEFKPRLVCPFDLTFDHKVIDGAEAARFVTHMCKNLADMKRLLL